VYLEGRAAGHLLKQKKRREVLGEKSQLALPAGDPSTFSQDGGRRKEGKSTTMNGRRNMGKEILKRGASGRGGLVRKNKWNFTRWLELDTVAYPLRDATQYPEKGAGKKGKDHKRWEKETSDIKGSREGHFLDKELNSRERQRAGRDTRPQ